MNRRRYARLVVRGRWVILAAWVVGAVLATTLLPGISGGGSLGTLVPSQSRAIDAERRAADEFGFPVLSRVVLVERRPGGFDRAQTAGTIQRGYELTRRLVPDYSDDIFAAFPLVNSIGPAGFVRQRDTTAVTYLLMNPDYGFKHATNRAQDLVDELVRPEGAAAGVTGAVPARAEQVRVIGRWLPLVELGTVILVAFAVGVHFRSVVAPLLVLVGIALPYVVGVHVVSGLGRLVDLSVPREVEPVMVVLLFGILTDYALFFLSRFRRRLAAGEAAREAAEHTIADQVGIVATAGIAVMAGTASLMAARLSFFQAFGPGVALAVGVGLLAALTFLPAALAILGSRVFLPARPGRDPDAGQRPGRMLTRVVRRPGVAVAACVAVLAAMASGLIFVNAGQTLIRGLPTSSPPREAYNNALQGFVPGVVSPALVLVEGPVVADRRVLLKRLQKQLSKVRGVAAVVGPRQNPLSRDFGAVYAPAGGAARMLAFVDSDPLGARAIGTVRRLQRRAEEVLRSAPDVRVTVAGDSAIAAEIVRNSAGDLARLGPLELVVIGAILVAFLRSLAAPLYMLAASALSLLAALGLTVYVFQGLFGFGELTYYVPFVAAVLLISLGSDYNVFLAGRLRETANIRPLREAVLQGSTRAAAAITVAGLVLAASFALLAIVPLRPFRELAFVMAVGLLIDTFMVRTLLVPALAVLVGERGGWPGNRRAAAAAAASAAAERV